ncbi:MAG: alpha-amylase family glycosyl hydrolase [Bryobacter sp.]|nr:alpha-amylase family glycosyl hydrolase [Bryobacter sp.]
MRWPHHPVIFEINAWTWCAAHQATLATIPESAWDEIAALGVDAVWLMGVWERSGTGIRIARTQPDLQEAYRSALPDYHVTDVVGSPYCVHRYQVEPELGGGHGLTVARGALARRGIRLLLDFVPNHVAPDHPWAVLHPEYFIQAAPPVAAQHPGEYFLTRGNFFAHGRDPYFAPWRDTLQLNAFHPGLREAARATVANIAQHCDGVRCDMAMLLLNDVFRRTWGERAGEPPAEEFWSALIPSVKQQSPDFLFIAEAYWDLEHRLLQLGFDYCYDKRLYDNLAHGSTSGVRGHLQADIGYQSRMVRFLENHDEPRAAATFAEPQQRAAAVLMMTLPGAKLLHEGQREGARVRLPVQLARRPVEPVNVDLRNFYDRLLAAVTRGGSFRDGHWELLETTGWVDNQTHVHLVAGGWNHAGRQRIVVVNYSPHASQGRIRIPWSGLLNRSLQLRDPLHGQVFHCHGNELMGEGLFVNLPPWGFHFFEVV